ncbi:MAG: LLM class flavin-dependent oxidoreductase [Caulobacteraceae bacterium]|nr:LLM class flavin-dependent oxidoreductase [Caulobacteraceae bacterium]
MKFGVSLGLDLRTNAAEQRENLYRLAALIEELGFDYLSVGHHVFTPDTGDQSAPFVHLAAIAARTSRLRLATGIYILPLYHPASVAEQVATLDQISDGRVIFGIGVGYRDYEFRGHGVDIKTRGARTDDAMAALRGAWTSGRWSHRGRFWTIEDLEAHPPTVQRPHPPMWVGGNSPAALRRAGTLGDGWMSDNMLDIVREKACVDLYRGFCAEAGRKAGAVCILRNAWVAPTREAAGEAVMPALRRFLEHYRRASVGTNPQRSLYSRIAHGEDVPLSEYTPGRALCGTPEDAIREVGRWRAEVGADYLQLMPSGPRTYETLRDMLTLFGKEVIPAVREAA